MMTNFQIPLNGSNFTSKDRQKAFQDALADDHRIECQDERPLTVADSGKPALAAKTPSQPVPGAPAVPGSSPNPTGPTGIEQALNHTFSHQSRTMEIHQQYLAQQTEYIQLITAVLNQQGKVLDSRNGSDSATIIETLQRTLDNFHVIRERGMLVHQEFLAQQAAFSERYLNSLDGGLRPAVYQMPAPLPPAAPSPSEWVVQAPHIVLDEQVPDEDAPPAAHSAAVELPAAAKAAASSSAEVSSAELAQALLQIVAEKTGYPAEMLDLNMDLEADLGIDSIKRVEILGALEEKFPSLPAADTQVLSQTRTLGEIVSYLENEAGGEQPSLAADAQATSQGSEEPGSSVGDQPPAKPAAVNSKPSTPAVEELTAVLLDIVAEKTGYPAEMLEPGMDMEADLGIDSIKRVEILGAMEERVPGLPSVEAEALGELRTLGQIVELMSSSGSKAQPAAGEAPASKKKADLPEPENTPVKLVPVPGPDRLEIEISQDHPLIVSSEGSQFTTQVVKALQEEGWKVLVWEYPAGPPPGSDLELPKGTITITPADPGKAALEAALASVRAEHGSPAGFIHLHPLAGENGLFSDQEEQLIKQVFLVAGSIKQDLAGKGSASRKLFLAVTRTDGALGMKNRQAFQEGSGLTGLVKSLHWEWPDVFCRAVDLHRGIKPRDAAALLIQEIHDPEAALLEVGIDQTSRVTIERDYGN